MDKVTEFTFSFASDATMCFILNILNDAFFEPDETFTLRLRQSGQSDQSVLVTIVSDDPLPTSITVAMNSYSVNEEGGSVDVCVVVNGDELLAPASIRVDLEDITATGEDNALAWFTI